MKYFIHFIYRITGYLRMREDVRCLMERVETLEENFRVKFAEIQKARGEINDLRKMQEQVYKGIKEKEVE